jgi:phosphate transport system substrate-binding protein
MRFNFLIFIIFLESYLYASTIRGSGSTLAAPLFYALSYHYYQSKNVIVTYDASNSYLGIERLKLGGIDFASSDKQLSEDNLKKNNLKQFPVLQTTINIVHNVKGIGNNKLHLTNETVADIFLKRITYWDDPKITANNKDIYLPHKKIKLVVRKAKSGTTYNFTKFLNTYSPLWKQKIGIVNNLELPNVLYGKNNENISTIITNTPYSIGYIPKPYCRAYKLSSIAIQDSKNRWVGSGEESYPLNLYNYILFSNKSNKQNKEAILFFDWILNNGNHYFNKLGYKPLRGNKE